MPKLNFTATELKDYFKNNVRHHFYDETVKLAKNMRVHSDGEFPGWLIAERRPNEPEEVLKYREKIYVAKTTPPYKKVLASLSKIRRSSDWSILYPSEKDRFKRVLDGERLEDYCERKFPYHASVTNWLFSVLLKTYGDDPNAVVMMLPLEWAVDNREYLKPYPSIFRSEDVLDFVPEDYAVLSNPLGSIYYVRGIPQEGKSYFVLTTQAVVRYDQMNSKGDLAPTLEQVVPFNRLPAWRIGALVSRAVGNAYCYESRLSPMLPELIEAVREYSDLQAAKVNHIFPERFEYTNRDCDVCTGRGQVQVVINGDPCIIPCKACGGEGVTISTRGPYGMTLLKPTSVLGGEPGKFPPPPGYVTKDVEIVRIQDEGVDKHIYAALSALNFQFLDQVPQTQSGVAKEVDKDELNNTVHAIAEDLVRNMDLVYRFAALWRYYVQYSPEEIIEFMLPIINVPEKYDLLSSSHLIQEMDSAKSLNPVIKNALEIEYATKKFISNPDVKERLMLIFELDPLPNISEDDKMSRLSNKGITQMTYVISSNIHEFVQRAIEEESGFPEMTLSDQKKIMEKYAQEKIDANEDKSDLVPPPDTGFDEFGNPVVEEPTFGQPVKEPAETVAA
jgi:hypothetical protein